MYNRVVKCFEIEIQIPKSLTLPLVHCPGLGLLLLAIIVVQVLALAVVLSNVLGILYNLAHRFIGLRAACLGRDNKRLKHI